MYYSGNVYVNRKHFHSIWHIIYSYRFSKKKLQTHFIGALLVSSVHNKLVYLEHVCPIYTVWCLGPHWASSTHRVRTSPRIRRPALSVRHPPATSAQRKIHRLLSHLRQQPIITPIQRQRPTITERIPIDHR